ncbi:di-N-acetylchitobiase-like [Leucoraja erinacea]|uniref:di-N-acetylchitobiase-like n=1 Tax=Leucoraja erinaceus TaxID=7782 RepID=UPI0024543FAF|nr:di-N-acetylchitobiase-like [Leucoraja erinacea]
MREGCVATSSSSYQHVLTGLSDYVKLGVDSRKLVMGVPWYGYDYTCRRIFKDGMCELETGFHEDPCSYPVARRIPYKEVLQRLLRSLTGRLWNDEHRVPYFSYLDGKTYHQVWYDDPESISMKSTFLKKLKLGGIGVTNLSDMDPSRTARATTAVAYHFLPLLRPTAGVAHRYHFPPASGWAGRAESVLQLGDGNGFRRGL